MYMQEQEALGDRAGVARAFKCRSGLRSLLSFSGVSDTEHAATILRQDKLRRLSLELDEFLAADCGSQRADSAFGGYVRVQWPEAPVTANTGDDPFQKLKARTRAYVS